MLMVGSANLGCIMVSFSIFAAMDSQKHKRMMLRQCRLCQSRAREHEVRVQDVTLGVDGTASRKSGEGMKGKDGFRPK
jgi:hypothetical protein